VAYIGERLTTSLAYISVCMKEFVKNSSFKIEKHDRIEKLDSDWVYKICRKCSVKYRAKRGSHNYICKLCKDRKYNYKKNTRLWYLKKEEFVNKYGCCQGCGSKKKLVLHHKDLDVNNNSDSNLALLCTKCHSKVHKTTSKYKFIKGKNVYKAIYTRLAPRKINSFTKKTRKQMKKVIKKKIKSCLTVKQKTNNLINNYKQRLLADS